MEREQIISALRCCKWDDVSMCKLCPYYKPSNSNSTCISEMSIDTLALIYELEAKNERLYKNLNETAKEQYINGRVDTVRKMRAEIEARCIKGGIYPAFVKSTIDKIAEEIINGSD